MTVSAPRVFASTYLGILQLNNDTDLTWTDALQSDPTFNSTAWTICDGNYITNPDEGTCAFSDFDFYNPQLTGTHGVVGPDNGFHKQLSDRWYLRVNDGPDDTFYLISFQSPQVLAAVGSASRFTSVTPLDDAIESSPVTVGATWFISQEDLDQLSSGVFGIGAGKIRVGAQVCPLNIVGSSICYPAVDWFLETTLETSTSTELTFGTSLPLKNNTDYQMIWQLTGSNYGNAFGPFLYLSTTTYFTVGTTPRAGNVRQAIASTTAAFRNSTSTDIYQIVNASCNPFSDGFDVGLCIYSIVAPPPAILAIDFQAFQTEFLTVAPWGYLTRFFSIITDTGTTTLPMIDFAFATSSPLFGYDIHLDPFGTLAQAGSIINATSTNADPKTIWQIMELPINLVVYLMLAFMIIKDLTQIHRNNSKNHEL